MIKTTCILITRALILHFGGNKCCWITTQWAGGSCIRQNKNTSCVSLRVGTGSFGWWGLQCNLWWGRSGPAGSKTNRDSPSCAKTSPVWGAGVDLREWWLPRVRFSWLWGCRGHSWNEVTCVTTDTPLGDFGLWIDPPWSQREAETAQRGRWKLSPTCPQPPGVHVTSPKQLGWAEYNPQQKEGRRDLEEGMCVFYWNWTWGRVFC